METGSPLTSEDHLAEVDTDDELQLERSLERLRNLVSEGDIEEARRFVKELEQRWPESNRVQYWARVLAPAKVTVRHGERSRPTDQERTWLRQHASEYPGQWLAVFGEQLIAADRDLGVVLKIVRETPGVRGAVLYQEPERAK
jgi:hypothetical protein